MPSTEQLLILVKKNLKSISSICKYLEKIKFPHYIPSSGRWWEESFGEDFELSMKMLDKKVNKALLKKNLIENSNEDIDLCESKDELVTIEEMEVILIKRLKREKNNF